MNKSHLLPKTRRLGALLLSVSLIGAACADTGSSAPENAQPEIAAPAITDDSMVATVDPSGSIEIDLPAEWDSVDVEPVSFFNGKGFNNKFKNSSVFKKGGFGTFNKFNNNKKFNNGFNSFKQFNGNNKKFNNQFNNQFKKFNNFNNFNNKKFVNNKAALSKGVSSKGFATKGFNNNFNNFNNFNNKGFNNFNTFGVNGKKGFNTNNFFKQGGRSSVFGFVAFEEVDSEMTKDLDMKMLDWIPTGENPMEMAENPDEGITIRSNELIESNGMKGMRTVLEVDLGDGEIQVVAQQALIDDSGEHLAVVVAGCELSCFEGEEAQIMQVMDSAKAAL